MGKFKIAKKVVIKFKIQSYFLQYLFQVQHTQIFIGLTNANLVGPRCAQLVRNQWGLRVHQTTEHAGSKASSLPTSTSGSLG